MQEVKNLDRKKPRFRRDTGNTIKAVSKHFFKVYKNKYKGTEDYIKDQRSIREILKSYHKNVQKIIAEDRGGFDLMSLVMIVTVSCPPPKEVEKNKLIDRKLSRELKKTIYFTNLDTDGTLCKIFCSFRTEGSKFLFKDSWGFKACRDLKQVVSKSFKKNHRNFIELISLRKTYYNKSKFSR